MKSLGLLKEIYDMQVPYIRLKIWPRSYNQTGRFSKMLSEISDNVTLSSSKLGGMPYIPYDSEYFYPLSPITNKPLNLLAQINFAEMPHLDPFPKDGILQFFINFDDDTFDSDSDDFFVQYIRFEDTNNGKYDNAGSLDDIVFENECALINEELNITGAIWEQPPTLPYVYLKNLFSQYSSNPDFDEAYSVINYHHNDHQIGGYPNCCQAEIWDEDLAAGDYILLLQLDYDKPELSEYCEHCGIISFFITRTDLENLDFSNVKRYWDCT